MADRFGFVSLKNAISIQLVKKVKLENVLKLLPYADTYQVNELLNQCYKLIDKNSTKFLELSGFLALPEKQFIQVLSRDSFDASELQIFKTVPKYVKQRGMSGIQDRSAILACVRLNLIPVEDIYNTVEESNYYSSKDLYNAVKVQNMRIVEKIRPRGGLGMSLYSLLLRSFFAFFKFDSVK